MLSVAAVGWETFEVTAGVDAAATAEPSIITARMIAPIITRVERAIGARKRIRIHITVSNRPSLYGGKVERTCRLAVT